MRENVEKALDKIRPALRADGGDIELIDVVDGVVKVRLTGACGGCHAKCTGRLFAGSMKMTGAHVGGSSVCS